MAAPIELPSSLTSAALSATIGSELADPASLARVEADSLYVSTANHRFADLAEPFIIPHRGYPALVAENTMESFRLAFSQGWPIMEGGDVMQLAAGTLVVCHETDLSGFTTATGSPGLQTCASWLQVVVDASSWFGCSAQDTRWPY